MAFPTSPTNGQQANINGITYTYSSAATAWTVSTSVSNTFVSINVSDNVNSGNVLATGVISATGNVTGGNILTVGVISATGNISANNGTFTGEISTSVPVATNGIVVNSLTVANSYTIAAGFSGMSAGPITLSGGAVVTVSSGSRWVIQ